MGEIIRVDGQPANPLANAVAINLHGRELVFLRNETSIVSDLLNLIAGLALCETREDRVALIKTAGLTLQTKMGPAPVFPDAGDPCYCGSGRLFEECHQEEEKTEENGSE